MNATYSVYPVKFTMLSKRHTLLYITFLLTITIGIRLIYLTRQGLWYDELQSVTQASLPIVELIKSVSTYDPHPPVYYLQLHFWMLAGKSDFWIRLNSVFWGSAAAISLFFVTLKRYGRLTAIISASLFALSPFAVYFSQQARMYAWMMFLAVWIWDFNYRCLCEKNNWKPTLGLLFFSLAFLYSHGAAFLIFASLIFQAVILLLMKRVELTRFIRWAILQLLILILYIPWLQRASAIRAGFGLSPDLTTIMETFSTFLFGVFSPRPIWMSILAFLIAIMVSAALLLRKEFRTDAIAFIILPVLACLVISYFIRPIWFYRTLAYMVPFYYLGIAAILTAAYEISSHRKNLRLLFWTSIVTFTISFSLVYQQGEPRLKWAPREAVEFVSQRADQDEIVMLSAWRLYWGWSWYDVGPGSINPRIDQGLMYSPKGYPILLKYPAEDLIRSGKTIWYVRRDIDPPLALPAMPGLSNELVYNYQQILVEKISLLPPEISSATK